jgi:hypothetical protein
MAPRKREYQLTSYDSKFPPLKRKRGRPKGSKNKPKNVVSALNQAPDPQLSLAACSPASIQPSPVKTNNADNGSHPSAPVYTPDLDMETSPEPSLPTISKPSVSRANRNPNAFPQNLLLAAAALEARSDVFSTPEFSDMDSDEARTLSYKGQHEEPTPPKTPPLVKQNQAQYPHRKDPCRQQQQLKQPARFKESQVNVPDTKSKTPISPLSQLLAAQRTADKYREIPALKAAILGTCLALFRC